MLRSEFPFASARVLWRTRQTGGDNKMWFYLSHAAITNNAVRLFPDKFTILKLTYQLFAVW
jgi:hypothetical protein